MNKWLKKSLELAQSNNYLDQLQSVYKLPNNEKRTLDKKIWGKVEDAFNSRHNTKLLEALLELDLFPIKHSFVAYFRREPMAINRNPQTVKQIADSLYSMGLDAIRLKCEEPKETNRQIGPLFKNYLTDSSFDIPKLSATEFRKTKGNAIYMGSDADSKEYAKEHLGYQRNKGLDFLARINSKYIIGEAKFLTDFGGHQNAQLDDAFSTLRANVSNCEKVLILDGVLFIKNDGKMYQTITQEFKDENIMSAILLKDFISEKLRGA